MTQLSTTRKADRETMARRIRDLALEHSFGVECLPYPANGRQRGIMISVSMSNDLSLMFDIDSVGVNARSSVFVLPWFIPHTRGLALSDHFGRIAGASVNPHHRRKCTSAVQGFDALIQTLAACFLSVAEGTAFEPSATGAAQTDVERATRDAASAAYVAQA